MRLIWQGIWLGAVALICFAASGVAFWKELSFGQSAVEVMATVTDRDATQRHAGSGPLGQAHYSLKLAFDLAGERQEVRQHVSAASFWQHGVGDTLAIHVDPAQPNVIEINGDEFAIWGLFLGIAGFAAAALSVLAFGTAYAGLLRRAKAQGNGR